MTTKEERAAAQKRLPNHGDLRKFVEVMNRKFVGNKRSMTSDDFYGIEFGSPDEAVCRVSDIQALLAELDRTRLKVGPEPVKTLGYTTGRNRCPACINANLPTCQH